MEEFQKYRIDVGDKTQAREVNMKYNIDKNIVIEFMELQKQKALKKAKYYTNKNEFIANMWRQRVKYYELARRALLKEINYDIGIYGRE